MRVRQVRAAALWSALLALLAFSAFPAAAQDIGYFGKNRLEFEPVDSFSFPDVTGTGIVDYQGGKEPSSQWRASLRFTGLEAGASYTVMMIGRFGDPGSPDADDFTPLCSVQTDDEGKGGCFWYFRGLARLNLVQLRTEDENESRMLEASRSGNLGSITTVPNRFSPGGEIPARKQSPAR